MAYHAICPVIYATARNHLKILQTKFHYALILRTMAIDVYLQGSNDLFIFKYKRVPNYVVPAIV